MSDEQRIRDRAYEIWEAKGRPEGQEAEHWAQARDEVEFYKEGDATAGSVLRFVCASACRSWWRGHGIH